jgi:hypothetical protein
MNFFSRVIDIVCPCFSKKEEQVLLEEVVVEDSCAELKEVVVMS